MLFFAALLLWAASSTEATGAVRFDVSEMGLDYASQLATTLINKKITGITLPDIS